MAAEYTQRSRRENALSGLHRRNSSVWKPETGVLYNPIEIIRSKSTRVKGSRVIPPNHLEEVKRYNLPNYRHYADNSVSTTTYKLFDSPIGIFYAIPRNLIHQFTTKWANWVFLFIAIINFFPVVGAYNKWLALFPPAFVLTTTMFKDFYEDYRRYRSDREVNNKFIRAWDRERSSFRKTTWKELLVGDIVHVSNDEDIPADLLFLRSSDEMGVCYVETSNLDGETSLKQRSVPKRYLDWSKEDSKWDPTWFTATVLCEKPDKAIYTVNAKLKYEPGELGRCDVITKENMLLRGSKLKNTTWVEGYVMYAGPDTKVMVNNGGARHKTSRIEKMTNWFILICFIMLILMVVTGGLLCALFQGGMDTVQEVVEEKKGDQYKNETRNVPNVPYMPSTIFKPAVSGLLDVLTLIICYQVIVPISLYITIDIIKMFQIKFINMDIDLYDEETDHRIDCRTWNIPEDLGQITHILSDKTGTLTENKMVFRKCAIDEIDYGGEFDHDSLDKIQAVASPALTDRVVRDWQRDETLKHFMRCIVLNNSVIVNKKPRKDVMDVGEYDETDGGVYTISNSTFFDIPREQFERMRNDVLPTPLEVPENANRHSWGTLSLIPEDDENTVVSSPNSPPYSVMQTTSPPTEVSIVRKTSRVSSFANAAWRTVKRPISFIFPLDNSVPLRMRGATMVMEDEKSPYEAESPDELALLQGALLYGFRLEARSMNHVVYEQPDTTMKNVKMLLILPFDSIRKRMSVIVETSKGPLMYTKGADSAIMERLSEENNRHKEDINNLVNKYSCQGLRTLCFAMKYLTYEEFEDFKQSYEYIQTVDTSDEKEKMLSEKADKIETELTLLGVTGIEDRLQDGVCETVTSLREAGIQIWVLTGDKLETAENIARASGLFEENLPIYTINCLEDFHKVKNIDEEKKFNLILSPDVVKTLKENPQVIDVLKKTKCVLCYRMAPSQKADIVNYVKKELKARSLAIGDGANDVPMIQEAHIGIGVKGKEGMQAVMSSDFAIARFKFLKKLLLVHGHWSYYRSALIFLYFLYKNANCVFILFYYQFFDGYSGAYSEDPTYSVLYPIIFTSVQPIVVGVLDQDYEAQELLRKPHLYRSGREGTSYTYMLFFLNMVDAMWQAAIVYFFTHLSLLGNTDGLWYFGFYLATGMMFVNCFHLMLEVRYWTHMLMVVFAVFFLLHFGFFFAYCLLTPTGSVNDLPTEVFNTAMSSSEFWLCLIAITVVALLPRFLLRVLHNSGLTFSVLNK